MTRRDDPPTTRELLRRTAVLVYIFVSITFWGVVFPAVARAVDPRWFAVDAVGAGHRPLPGLPYPVLFFTSSLLCVFTFAARRFVRRWWLPAGMLAGWLGTTVAATITHVGMAEGPQQALAAWSIAFLSLLAVPGNAVEMPFSTLAIAAAGVATTAAFRAVTRQAEAAPPGDG